MVRVGTSFTTKRNAACEAHATVRVVDILAIVLHITTTIIHVASFPFKDFAYLAMYATLLHPDLPKQMECRHECERVVTKNQKV